VESPRVTARALGRIGGRRIALLAALLWACNNGLGPSGDVLIELLGRVERSSVVTLRATRLGLPFNGAGVAWSVTPTDAVEFLPGDQIRLIRATRITLTVTGSGLHGDFTTDVPPPPSIVFDLLKNGNRDIYRATLDGLDTLRLSTRNGDDLDPTATGGSVVYVSYGDGNGELYTVPLAGGTPVRLTNTVVGETEPALSRDGLTLAFIRPVSGVPKLWSSAADGTGAVRLTTTFGFGGSVEAAPTWSPTGDRVAFVATSSGSADLFAWTRSSGAIAGLLADSGFTADVEPTWNASGTAIAFAS
jgi:hypothetical protein